MEPGRKLDALVAEKVMGWKDCEGGRGSAPEGGRFLVPHYSDGMGPAWEVVEKLRSDSNNHMIEIFWDCDTWFCVIQSHNKELVKEWCETAPHAICLAALKAVGVEVKD